MQSESISLEDYLLGEFFKANLGFQFLGEIMSHPSYFIVIGSSAFSYHVPVLPA